MIEFDPTHSIYTNVANSSTAFDRVRTCAANVESSVVSTPAETFALNIEAIQSVLKLPWLLGVYCQGYGAGAVIRFAVDYLDGRELPGEELKAAFEATTHRQSQSADEEEEPDEFVAYADIVEVVTNRLDTKPAIRSLLMFAAFAAWAALESLAKDMWVVSVNTSLDQLGKNALNTQDARSRSNETKSISAKWLSKYQFDLRHCMGTLLVEDEKKFTFDSPERIRKAYTSAFDEPAEFIRIWVASSEELHLLNLVRNLIAHKAAIVDERFNNQAGLDLPMGKPLPLNTTNVLQLVDVAVNVGCKLLEFVDKWFTTNTELDH